MLRTIERTRDASQAQRLAAIGLFTLLTVIFARVTLEIGPVPLTLQTLAVFLCGLVLGARDGALAQLFYVGLIAAGLPFDARGLGPAVFAGPTWGYLVGFIPAAFVTGWLVERYGRTVGLRALACFAGSLVVFVLGVTVLKSNLNLTWEAAISTGFLAFFWENLAKVVLAAGIAEGARAALLRMLMPGMERR